MITKLNINHWNQFGNISLDFHDDLTIITGTNGSGKSTILRLLSKLVGWSYTEVGLPNKTKNSYIPYLSGIFHNKILNLTNNSTDNNDTISIGNLNTSTGNYELHVPTNSNSISYSVIIKSLGSTGEQSGVSINSHRLAFNYKKLEHIPAKPVTRTEAYDSYYQTMKKRNLQDQYFNPREENPTLLMKSALISLAVFSQGNDYVEKNDDSYKLFRDFIEILKILLPSNLKFQDITVRSGELILQTETGEFLLDAVSGGIGAIIDLAWQLHLFEDTNNKKSIAIIDEVENHLHPSMQRNLLPNLLTAFPNYQFIVTTHSPFVISSVPKSTIYALKYNENNQVNSCKLDFEQKASNAMDILRDILGVPVTLPIWIENKVDNITEKYKDTELTPESYLKLKNDLSKVGLDDYMPQALSSLNRGDI